MKKEMTEYYEKLLKTHILLLMLRLQFYSYQIKTTTKKPKAHNSYILRKDLGKTVDVLMSLFDDKSDLAQETDLIRPLIV